MEYGTDTDCAHERILDRYSLFSRSSLTLSGLFSHQPHTDMTPHCSGVTGPSNGDDIGA